MVAKLAEICAPIRARPGAPHFHRALDLGAGTGLTGASIGPYAGEMHGLDLSPEMLELANRSGVYSRTFVAGMTDFLTDPPAGAHRSYDFIVAGDALVYLGDLAPLFTGAVRRLNPGGWFLFTVEALAAGDFTLQTTGRYPHGAEYIRVLALDAGFEPGNLDRITPRRDGAVTGLLGCFHRP